MWGTSTFTGGNDSNKVRSANVEDVAESGSEQETELIELEEVEYPFSYKIEEGRLILCEEAETSRYWLRVYEGEGELIQEFPCDVGAKELVFRSDQLYHYYGYDHDLEVFPADAEETGAEGLLFPWDDETQRFSEEPIVIPWYEKRDLFDNAYLVQNREGDMRTSRIYRINEETREPVELRRWTLTEPYVYGEESVGHLQIWDNLENVELYDGEVKWDKWGEMVNDKYYQELFWRNLEHFWNYTKDTEIPTAVMWWDGEDDHLETMSFGSREELLAEYGFTDEEPFYQYYDRFQNLILELYFDEQTGQGCGFHYSHNFNYQLEEIESVWGFAFNYVSEEEWVPADTFSTLTYDGQDARRSNVSGYQEIYSYTDDGKLSSFEARGTIMDYGEEREESSLLSMDYFYRNDGTLFIKDYSHHHILFGSTYGGQASYYDELGRLSYQNSYVTHGSYLYYYIYEDDEEQLSYCLFLDDGMGYVLPTMIAYK